MNDTLRIRVKELKIYQNVSYKELAEYLEISSHGFYNWLNGYYNFSYAKQNRLKEIIDTIQE